MPIGSAFHARTLELCESLNYRDWAGYYAVSAYETHHEHEYNAIRNACALIDISPLFKYRVSGPGADPAGQSRHHARRGEDCRWARSVYTPWCDEDGKVIDDGTVTRVAEQVYRWTAAHPNLRWLSENARGPRGRDRGHLRAACRRWRCRARRRARCCRRVCTAPIDGLKYFRAATGAIGGVPVDVTRTGYTGDLGYEIWMPWDASLQVWDAIVGCRPRLRSASHRHAGARCRAGRGRAAADRRGLPQQPQGADRVAEVLAVRARAGAARRFHEALVRRPHARSGTSSKAATRGRSSGSRWIGRMSRALYEVGGPAAHRAGGDVARGRAGLQRAARRWAAPPRRRGRRRSRS